MSEGVCAILKYILFCVFCIILVHVLTFFAEKEKEHEKLHEEVGYESIGILQTSNRYGEPKFYRAVRYKDGCEDSIIISAGEYFEEVNND